MRLEEDSEFDGEKVSKENRRNNLDAEKQREIYNPFKLYVHKLKRKFVERRAHQLEQQALKSKRP
jgi:hypothetical protein